MRYEDIIPFYQKLNYRCPKGKYVADSYKCGNTPEEAKANYDAEQKIKAEKQKGVDDRRGKRAERISGKAEKRISTIKDPILLEKVTNVKSLIDKAKSELASGKVSKQTYKELRLAVNELRDQASKSGQNVKTPTSKENNNDISNIINPTKQVTNNPKNNLPISVEDAAKKMSKSMGYEEVSPILKQQIENARKPQGSFMRDESLKDLRKLGFDINGDPLLSKNELLELQQFNKAFKDGIIKEGEKYVNYLDNNKIDLFHKGNMLSEGKQSGVPGTKITTEMNNITYQLPGGKEFNIIFEPGMEKSAKTYGYILSTMPENLVRTSSLVLTDAEDPDNNSISKKYGFDVKVNGEFSLQRNSVTIWHASKSPIELGLIYHEFAHSLDNKNKKYDKNKKTLSLEDEYKNAFDQDKSVLNSKLNSLLEQLDTVDEGSNERKNIEKELEDLTDNGNTLSGFDHSGFVSGYSKGVNNIKEDFADSVKSYMINPTAFKNNFPNRAKYFNKIIGSI